MSANQLVFLAAAACLSFASAKEEFPLVWVCLGVAVVGLIIVVYVAYRRPTELYTPDEAVVNPLYDEEEIQEKSEAVASQRSVSRASVKEMHNTV